jgi:2-dehydro-3-deoxyphosphogalactonate aldolase
MAPADLACFSADFDVAPVIAIQRGLQPDDVLRLAEALVAGGIRFVETTLNSPDPFTSIRRCTEEFAGGEIHVGAGTVLTPEEVERVAEAGGTYIVSPNFNAAVVRKTKELGLVSVPGFLTPSEAFAAVEAGADFLKCFPARALGPGYFKDIRAVLPNPIVAVGGVNTDTAGDYIRAGAVGVGVGSSIVNRKLIAAGRWDGLSELGRRFLDVVLEARQA